MFFLLTYLSIFSSISKTFLRFSLGLLCKWRQKIWEMFVTNISLSVLDIVRFASYLWKQNNQQNLHKVKRYHFALYLITFIKNIINIEKITMPFIKRDFHVFRSSQYIKKFLTSNSQPVPCFISTVRSWKPFLLYYHSTGSILWGCSDVLSVSEHKQLAEELPKELVPWNTS